MMTTMIKKTFLLFLFISFVGLAFSQEDDFGVWLGVNAKHKIIKKLDVDFSGCIRTFNKTSQIEQSFLEGGIEYNVMKHLSLSASYRFINKLEDNSKYYFRHKLFFDVKANIPAGNFSFSGRLRFQRTTKTYIEDNEDLIAKYYSRFKLKVSYSIPDFPLKAYVYCEPFIPVFSNSGLKVSKNRLSAGAELQIANKSSVELEYIFQRDYQPHISNEHIISLSYKIKF